ncbi:AraC family transcriptional regulator [Umezawaea endophytica]|uniref:AraC family transcriptional regulator n=1 Tax=Umezawaea endophytica TaxID=1654476 RepID=A0A9X2VGH3_9PSEU|nr:AraC family transcriptional regulator [Umezawaea endophytica]MCS7475672.1 AraC family transcriptional regulator [Umezawaea endophytica]
MAADHLSEVFDLVEVRSVLSGGMSVRGPWESSGVVETRLKFFAMVSGRARLTTDGVDGPVDLEPGDVAVLNNRSWLRVEGGTGDGPRRVVVPDADFAVTRLDGPEDVMIGGRVELNPIGEELLLQALPPLGHVRAAARSGVNLRGSIHRLFDEVAANRVGSAFAIRQHCQLLLLEVLRAHVDQTELPPGWLQVLTDERVRPALGLMHADPAKSWGLEELARAAAMSRTTFAERFRAAAGVPPLAYLNRWRMLLAQRALRDRDVRVGSLAVELGYASESAFSTAFKREVGESPLRYRNRARDTSAAPRRDGVRSPTARRHGGA